MLQPPSSRLPSPLRDVIAEEVAQAVPVAAHQQPVAMPVAHAPAVQPVAAPLTYAQVASGVRPLVHEIFTNYAHFDANGCLQISEYHMQNWCKLSSVNLCKGSVMEEYLDRRRKQGVNFDTVSYVGDGNNDLCPCLRLRSCDLIFPRADYPLAKQLAKDPEQTKAKLHPWRTGLDIASVLLKNCVVNNVTE
ncbi:hypothetical protein HPB51_013855 [Rhipicephalus microplus]|uniref:Uncharacterized protein n=1 Tax=Rhipicephalus microplus TaxID=6941 RepID=A0A9J6F3D6_RHIMP|nr:hypothetical protein HPB51_013855 [Rhipicephalus microplus]